MKVLPLLRVILVFVLLSGYLHSSSQFCEAWGPVNGIFKEYNINGGVNPVATAISDDGSYIVAGNYGTDSVLFGNGIFIHKPNSYAGCFIAGYDTNGMATWAHGIGGNNIEYIESVCSDEDNNHYLFGRFRTDTLFIAGDTLVNQGVENIFTVKLDESGNMRWAKSMGSQGGWDRITQAHCRSGKVYFSGFYKQSGGFAFDTLSLPATFYSRGFVICMDSMGAPLWSFSSSGSNAGHVEFSDFSLGPNGKIALAGRYSGGPLLDTLLMPFIPGSRSAGFLAQYGPNGNILWAKHLESPLYCALTDVASDDQGNLYTGGWHLSDSIGFAGQWLFNPDPFFKLFVQKTDPNGNLQWWTSSGSSTGGNSGQVFQDILILHASRPWLVQQQKTDSLFFGTDTVIPPDQTRNIGLFELDAANGKLAGLKFIEGGGEEFLGSASSAAGAGLAICGAFSHSLPLVFGNDSLSYPWPGNGNVGFVTTLTQKAAGIAANDTSFCQGDSLILHALTFPGLDYQWLKNGQALWNDTLDHLFIKQPGLYSLAISDGGGCTDTSAATLVIMDSAYALQIHDSACHGDPYLLPDSTIIPFVDSSQLFQAQLLSQSGCDSLVELWLEVIHIDTTVVQNANVLEAVFPADSYQWLDCENSFAPIPGANQPSFTAQASGRYAVSLEKGDCVDTSGCHQVVGVGMTTFLPHGEWISPNPSHGVIHIRTNTHCLEELVLYTIQGKPILHKQFAEAASEKTLDISHLPGGIYFLILTTPTGQSTHKIIRK